MRSIWVGLIVLTVVLTSLRMHSSKVQPATVFSPTPVSARAVDAPPPATKEGEVVVGYGVSATAAQERALEKARECVQEQLARRLHVPSCHPPEDLLNLECLTRFGVVRSLGEPVVGPQLNDEQLLVARYRVRLEDDYVRAVARAARHAEMTGRHMLVARILAGLIGLLLVTVGYLRMEEMTRGYATQLLRVAAAGIIALIGLGLWLSL